MIYQRKKTNPLFKSDSFHRGKSPYHTLYAYTMNWNYFLISHQRNLKSFHSEFHFKMYVHRLEQVRNLKSECGNQIIPILPALDN